MSKPVKTKKRKRALTQKQKAFAQGLAEGKTIIQAARDAGYSEEVAKGDAYRYSELPQIIEETEDIKTRNRRLLEKAGLGESKRFKKLADLTEAQKVISAVVVNPASSDAVKAGGKTTDFIEVPDNTTQLNALKEAHKLAGDYPAERLELDDRRPVRLITSLGDPLKDAIDITPDEPE